MRTAALIASLGLLSACNPAVEAPPASPALGTSPSAPPRTTPPSPAGSNPSTPPAPSAPPKKASKPVLFNTPEADAILSSLQVFPKDNPWNEDISERPVHPDSDRMIDKIGRQLRFRWNHDMSFILVPPDQPKVPLHLEYKDESDPGPYPIPDDAPLEGWPLHGGPLKEMQRPSVE